MSGGDRELWLRVRSPLPSCAPAPRCGRRHPPHQHARVVFKPGPVVGALRHPGGVLKHERVHVVAQQQLLAALQHRGLKALHVHLWWQQRGQSAGGRQPGCGRRVGRLWADAQSAAPRSPTRHQSAAQCSPFRSTRPPAQRGMQAAACLHDQHILCHHLVHPLHWPHHSVVFSLRACWWGHEQGAWAGAQRLSRAQGSAHVRLLGCRPLLLDPTSLAMLPSMLAPLMPAVPQMPRLGTTIVASPPLLLLAIASRSCTTAAAAGRQGQRVGPHAAPTRRSAARSAAKPCMG